MVFTSVLFLLVFFPVFLILYHVVPNRAKNAVALVASLVFYAWGAPKFFWILLGLLIANFYIVREVSKTNVKARKKAFMRTSVLINLGTLAYFKYANFFVENVNALLTSLGASQMSWVEVALPIGISFFTFQSLTYTLDVYWGRHKPLDKITDYLLYILLFPQLIAGPIIRFNTIADEIKDRRHNFTPDYKLNGMYIFVIGLAKKVLIANEVGHQADLIFAQQDGLPVWMSWLGVVAYSVQIYFDFSGYSDMAIGLGKIMGFNFPENFKNPYTSKSITEFWRRWHITLGAFMRDYLYIPLGGNRTKTVSRIYFNLFIVFLLSGLWHGASWNFVIWGAWHGIFLAIERGFLKKWLDKIPAIFSLLYTYAVVLIGWVFFRAETLPEAWTYLENMVGVNTNPTVEIAELTSDFYVFLILGLIFSFITLFGFGKRAEHFFFYKSYSIKQHVLLSVLSLIFFTLSVSYIVSSGFNPFIYFRF